MLWGERRGNSRHRRRYNQPMERPMPQPNDLSRSLFALEQDATFMRLTPNRRKDFQCGGVGKPAPT